MLRPLLAATAGVMLLATTAVLADAAPGSPGSPGSVDWAPCADRPEFECATLARPIDRGRPDGGTFGMALARHRATDPDRRIGVLVVNPGGPGMSGVDFTFGSRWNFSPEVLARFDIVGFDPRGVGLSQAVRCSADLYFGGPPARPTDQAGFDELSEHNRQLHADCARRSGPIADHVSTEDVVEDVDALRRALGEPEISFYGLSYGTVIGQRYAERHGDKVRAMLLDSVVDRGLDAGESAASAARAAADSYEEWKRWNARTPSSPLHGQDIDALWDGLMARADRGELVDLEGSGDPLTPYDLSAGLTITAYGPDWEDFSAWVLSLNGVGVGVTPPASDGEVTPPSDEPEDGKDTSLYAGAMAHISCADQSFRVRTYAEYAELTRQAQRISPRTLGSDRGNTLLTSCVGLPEASTPQQPGAMRTKVPTLLINSRHDPSTSHENAASVHRRQRGATVLVTYEGAGHGVYDRNDCTRRVSDAYLVSLDVPRDGLSCPSTDQ
ncbi:alpha/beta fold hydrolase [Streptomyces sp. CHD11]|uniref:alpha/beta fold hydrolase n=1 Tax=Streptomyces sp. CHD11 TaxID=2741325 RepID=UPI001BFC5EB2|nr:alpha/beta fold hydrolase [Streptomyces sp. CHD11]MBT3154949.1 alpha/beta fold hydrolase [Streptomyces sp. CHD11]